MKKYFIEKEFYSKCCDSYISYETGAYDDMNFETEAAAKAYAERNLYRLENNEAFSIYEVDIIEEIEYVERIKKGE